MPIVRENEANLDERPEGDTEYPADNKNQITIGDLHGNALKLIYFLVRQNVFVIESADYEKIVKIYKNFKLDKNDLIEFDSILTRIKVQAVGTVRLIGDEVADRGMNDYFTLKLLKLLKEKKVPVEIILSNHGVEFVEACEKSDDFKPPRLYSHHAKSMLALQKLIDQKLVTREEVLKIADDVYKSFLRALSYTLSEDKKAITIYSHACIGLDAIKALTKKLELNYCDKTAEELAQTIDDINAVFQTHVENKTVYSLYENQIMVDGYFIYPIDQNENPFEFLMWNRSFMKLERPHKHSNEYAVVYVHGHHPFDKDAVHIINLDNMLGKSLKDHVGDYRILISQETPSPQLVIKQGEVEEIKREGIVEYNIDEGKNPLNKENISACELYNKNEVMKKNEESLKETDNEKGVIQLSNELKIRANNFFSKPRTQATLSSFHEEFSVKLHSKDDQMNIHRNI